MRTNCWDMIFKMPHGVASSRLDAPAVGPSLRTSVSQTNGAACDPGSDKGEGCKIDQLPCQIGTGTSTGTVALFVHTRCRLPPSRVLGIM